MPCIETPSHIMLIFLHEEKKQRIASMKKSFTLVTFFMTLSICLVSYSKEHGGTNEITNTHPNENPGLCQLFEFDNMESAKRAFHDTQKTYPNNSMALYKVGYVGKMTDVSLVINKLSKEQCEKLSRTHRLKMYTFIPKYSSSNHENNCYFRPNCSPKNRTLNTKKYNTSSISFKRCKINYESPATTTSCRNLRNIKIANHLFTTEKLCDKLGTLGWNEKLVEAYDPGRPNVK